MWYEFEKDIHGPVELEEVLEMEQLAQLLVYRKIPIISQEDDKRLKDPNLELNHEKEEDEKNEQ